MKNILKIFKHDLKNVAKNMIVFIVVIGISILPALYAWFNIAANWDPYSSTGGIPFAVCSNDKGFSYKAIGINAGDQIISNLKQNDKMGWTFVDQEEAVNGVNEGRYYAAVIIPENFSECLCSIISGKFEQAKLEYYVNEKKNAIAPKITNTGINTVQEQISSTYVNTITTIIATTLNLTTGEITNNKANAANSLIDTLQAFSTEIDSFSSSIDILSTAMTSLDDVIDTNKAALPDVQKKFEKVVDFPQDVKTSIQTTQNTAKQISSSIEEIIDSLSSSIETINQKLNKALDNTETNIYAAAEELSEISVVNDQIISVNNTMIGILESMNSHLGVDTSDFIANLKLSNATQQELMDKISSASETIAQTSSLARTAKEELKTLAQTMTAQLSQLKTSFQSVKNSLNDSIEKVYTTIDNISGILQSLNNDIPKINEKLDNASNSVQKINSTFDSLKEFLENSKSKVQNIITKIENLRDSTAIENVISSVIENPTALGNFVSSPVTTVTNSVYPVENYGSGMTPFYTSLSFWVGGIILVAVVRADLTKKELRELGHTNSTELFFGRYLIFFFLGQIQAWIISLGDIFFLKVQCNNPFLFIIGSLISSFVYTLIIYSLTITFSVIGKALAVIILVIQIAGAGGTFPIEVLPAPFQAVSPYLPFKYGINILREAVAGADMNSYFYNLELLLAFIIFALILGLLLRRPCIKLVSFFDNRVEQSDIII